MPRNRRRHDTPTARENWSNNDLWPFTVDRGILTCHAPDWVTFTASGPEYALTDDARWLGHYQDVSAILVKGFVAVGTEFGGPRRRKPCLSRVFDECAVRVSNPGPAD